jgi:hypothetical protein
MLKVHPTFCKFYATPTTNPLEANRPHSSGRTYIPDQIRCITHLFCDRMTLEDLDGSPSSPGVCPICYEPFSESLLLPRPGPGVYVADDHPADVNNVSHDVETGRPNGWPLDEPQQLIDLSLVVLIPECGHVVCHECIYQYLVHHLSNGPRIALPIPCPILGGTVNGVAGDSSDQHEVQKSEKPGSRPKSILSGWRKNSGQKLQHERNEQTNGGCCSSSLDYDFVSQVLLSFQDDCVDAGGTRLCGLLANQMAPNKVTSLLLQLKQAIQLQTNPALIPCPSCNELVMPPEAPSEATPQSAADAASPRVVTDTTDERKALPRKRSSERSSSGTGVATATILSGAITSPPSHPALPAILELGTTMNCPRCQVHFCSLHGTVHPNVTCYDYYQKQRGTRRRSVSPFPPDPDGAYYTQEGQDSRQGDGDDEFQRRVLEQQASDVFLSTHTKPCSHCSTPICKSGGCDHVLCPVCHMDMCYRCGTHVHLTGKVIRTCSQCQQGFLDHRYERQYRCRLLLCLPLLMPAIIMYMALALVLCVLCLGCYSTHSYYQQRIENRRLLLLQAASRQPTGANGSVSSGAFNSASDLQTSGESLHLGSTKSFSPLGKIVGCCTVCFIIVFLPVILIVRDMGCPRFGGNYGLVDEVISDFFGPGPAANNGNAAGGATVTNGDAASNTSHVDSDHPTQTKAI